jgi:peroxiredoxin
MLLRRPAPLLALLLAAAPAAAQVVDEPAPAPRPAPPAGGEVQVDEAREQAALEEINAYAEANQIPPPKEQEEAERHFTAFRDGLLALEKKHHGTWAAWQALMTVGQIESRIFRDRQASVTHYRRVWQGVRLRTDTPPQGIFLNVPRVAMRFAEELMRIDQLDEAEVVLREVAGTELPEGERIRERLREIPDRRRMLPGQPAPQVEMVDTAGRALNLAEMRGKVVLVQFWSAIHGGSLSTMPQVKELLEQHAAAGLVVVSVNTDLYVTRETHEQMKAAGQRFLPRLFDREDLDEAVARHGMDWPVVWDGKGLNGPVPDAFTVRQLPSVYVIGRDGRIVIRDRYNDDLTAAVERALATED